jgi:predicted ester cyclase
MSEESNMATLRQSIEYHNNPETRDRYLDTYSEDLVLHGSVNEGYEELQAFYRALWEILPDLTVTIMNMIAEDDEVAARYSWSGTHAETGEDISLESGLTWYRFEDGAIVERWVASGTGDMIEDMVGL